MAATTYTSLNIFADRIIKLLEGRLSSENRLDRREVVRMIRDAINHVLMAEIKRAYVEGEKTIDVHYVATFRNLDIVQDDDTEMYYTLIPTSFVSLYNQQGIQQVTPITREGARGDALIPLSPGEMEIYRNLPAGSLEGLWAYEIDRDRIWYLQNDRGEEIIRKYSEVDMRVVTINYENIDDDAQIPIPGELYKTIMDTVLDTCIKGFQLPVDRVNDNQPVGVEK
jgi:hypothetical protein